jgi:hypothetical protein
MDGYKLTSVSGRYEAVGITEVDRIGFRLPGDTGPFELQKILELASFYKETRPI